MKTLIVSFVFLGFVIFFGCQNSITDPVSPETTNYSGVTDDENVFSKDWFSFHYPNFIRLEGTLLDPSHKVNGYAEISGIVRYGVSEVSQVSTQAIVSYSKNAPNGTPPKDIKVDLYVKAEIKGGCKGLWNVAKTTDAIVKKGPANEPIYYIEKKIRVKNTCCAPLNLVLKFELRNKNVRLVGQRLELVPGVEPIVIHQ